MTSEKILREVVIVYLRPELTVLNKARLDEDAGRSIRKMSDAMNVIEWGRTPPRVCG